MNDANALLDSAFSGDNFKIVNGMAKNKKCIIFCSGNGLWFPDTDGCFRQTIISNDRYEWSTTASHVLDYVERLIFIRDLHKCWYAGGINDRIDSIDKLADFLAELCRGFRTVVTGNSAGGYIASLLGYKLHADFVLNWSGQWNIWKCGSVTEDYFFVKKYASDESRARYYDIVSLLQDSTVPVYYFYPAHSEQDIIQYACVKNLPSVYPIALDSARHGAGVGSREYFALLLSDPLQLQELYEKASGNLFAVAELEALIDTLPMAVQYHEFDAPLSGADKTKIYREILLKWVRIQQQGKSLFGNDQFSKVTNFAVYGRGGESNLLIEELKLAHKSICCIVESNPSSSDYEGYPVVKPDDLNESVEAVIAVPCYAMDAIRSALLNAGYNGLICGLDELLEQAAIS
ncbi:MAG: hypothetical protein K6G18_13020 [Treponema sp.]|nr:hypothetical protein [Treponema sp.]